MSTRLDIIEDRLVAIEARLDALETSGATAPAIRFLGPWRDGVAYRAGAAVVRGGSLYLADRDAAAGEVPGVYAQGDGDDDRSVWRLAAKRGKDGTIPADLERRLRRLEQQT